jgi:hypothetical protein
VIPYAISGSVPVIHYAQLYGTGPAFASLNSQSFKMFHFVHHGTPLPEHLINANFGKIMVVSANSHKFKYFIDLTLQFGCRAVAWRERHGPAVSDAG